MEPSGRHRSVQCLASLPWLPVWRALFITTVVGLLVAIPAMFGSCFLVTSVRSMIVRADNFAAELSSEIVHRCVFWQPEELREALQQQRPHAHAPGSM